MHVSHLSSDVAVANISIHIDFFLHFHAFLKLLSLSLNSVHTITNKSSEFTAFPLPTDWICGSLSVESDNGKAPNKRDKKIDKVTGESLSHRFTLWRLYCFHYTVGSDYKYIV